MDFDAYLKSIKGSFNKTFKANDVNLELNPVSKELPATGIVLDNPLLEYCFDRRFMAYGRCYLVYGKKGCSKTTLLFDLAKIFQKAGGRMFWIETESAPDFDYMKKQGVDPDLVHYHNPRSLEEALTLCKTIIENIPKFDPEGTTPIMVALDSIAGACTEYERERDVVGETKVGEHAKLMSNFYRNIIPYVEAEKVIFVATNQLKEQIGGMAGFGTEKPEALIGGEAQRFNSTYQFKVVRIKDVTDADEYGVERKSGSIHTLTVKRNKLGREGNSQKVEFDIHIDGGIDWYAPLIRTLADKYPHLVKKGTVGRYIWVPENTAVTDPVTGEVGVIPTRTASKKGPGEDVAYQHKVADLAELIKNSHEAKELCRTAFGIPDMPSEEVRREIEQHNKTKRPRKSALEVELDEVTGEEEQSKQNGRKRRT